MVWKYYNRRPNGSTNDPKKREWKIPTVIMALLCDYSVYQYVDVNI